MGNLLSEIVDPLAVGVMVVLFQHWLDKNYKMETIAFSSMIPYRER